MFADAYELVSQFTRPVAVSRRAWNGKCSGGIGTFIVLNDDGWLLTAGHLIDQMIVMDQEHQASLQHEAAVTAIEADSALDHSAKSKEKKARHSTQESIIGISV